MMIALIIDFGRRDYFVGAVNMVFGNAEFLEIAAFQDSAESLLKAKIGDAVSTVVIN